MNEQTHKMVAAAGSVVAGVVIGWGANALTLTGRVAAIEAGQARMEAMVTRLLDRPPTAAPASVVVPPPAAVVMPAPPAPAAPPRR